MQGRTFRTTIPHSRFLTKDGESVYFDGTGHLETDDPDLIHALDAVADKSGCPIYKANRTASNFSQNLEPNGVMKVEDIVGITEDQLHGPDPVQVALASANSAKQSTPSVSTGMMGSNQLATAKK